MRKTALLPLIALAALSGSATARSDRNTVPEARETGAAVDCIQLSSVRKVAFAAIA